MVGYFVGKSPGEGAYVAEYIRADLVEAAIKRALEGVVDVLEDEGWLGDSMLRIRALDPAQFIEEPKP
jgi:hypothetical protein